MGLIENDRFPPKGPAELLIAVVSPGVVPTMQTKQPDPLLDTLSYSVSN
jgi:hypothetical protein